MPLYYAGTSWISKLFMKPGVRVCDGSERCIVLGDGFELALGESSGGGLTLNNKQEAEQRNENDDEHCADDDSEWHDFDQGDMPGGVGGSRWEVDMGGSVDGGDAAGCVAYDGNGGEEDEQELMDVAVEMEEEDRDVVAEKMVETRITVMAKAKRRRRRSRTMVVEKIRTTAKKVMRTMRRRKVTRKRREIAACSTELSSRT